MISGVPTEDGAFAVTITASDGTSTTSATFDLTFAQPGADDWFLVQFAEALDDPSVILGPPTYEGRQAAAMRIRNVTDEGFEFQIDEWNYLDGAHVPQTVSWIAVESGTHTIDGLTVVAGVDAASGETATVGFGETFDDTPIVLAQVSSTNDTRAVTDRLDAVTETGFDVRLQSEETDYGTHGTETLSWIAFEGGGAADDGLLIARTPTAVNHEGYDIDFGSAFEEDQFAFIADLQTERGRDPATLRLTFLTQSSASAFVEEEQSLDTETDHLDEEVGFIALSQGVLFNDVA